MGYFYMRGWTSSIFQQSHKVVLQHRSNWGLLPVFADRFRGGGWPLWRCPRFFPNFYSANANSSFSNKPWCVIGWLGWKDWNLTTSRIHQQIIGCTQMISNLKLEEILLERVFFVSALEFSTFNCGSWFRDKNPIKLGLNRYRNVLCPGAFDPHPWMVTGCFYVPSFVYKPHLLYLTYPSVVSNISMVVGSLDDRYLIR